MTVRICQNCGKLFKIETHEVLRGVGKFCSRACFDQWNKQTPALLCRGETESPTVKYKTCAVCGRDLPITQFRPRSKNKGKRKGVCIECEENRTEESRKSCYCQVNGTVSRWLEKILSTTDNRYFTRAFLLADFLEENPDFIKKMQDEGFVRPKAQLKKYITNYLRTRPDIIPGAAYTKDKYRYFYRVTPGEKAGVVTA